MTTAEKQSYKKGGSFIVENHELESIFIPEEFTDEDRLMARATEEFVAKEVLPQMKQLELGRNEDMVKVLKQAGELGLLSAEVPEEFGGMNISKTVATLMSEKVAPAAGLGHRAGAGRSLPRGCGCRPRCP